jgi:hypothetical protein
MAWINEHKNVGRVAVLMLLLVAIVGPWTYTSDGVGPSTYSSGGVPPAAWCRDPNVLLENGRCVRLVSGATVFTFMASAFLSMSVGLVTGEIVFADRAGELLGVFLFTILLFLLVLPFFSTLFLIRGGGSRRLRVFHLVAWGLAAVLSLLPAMSASVLPPVRLWGIWLYFGLAASALILELLALAAGSRSSQG